MAEEMKHRKPAEILARRRLTAEREAEERREEIYRRLPELARCNEKAAALCRDMTGAALEGDSAALEAAKAELGRLAEARKELLRKAGLGEEVLQPRYTCPLCRDRGYVNGHRCRCLTELLQQEAARELPTGVLRSVEGFDGFDLSYYSDEEMLRGVSFRSIMKNILAYCRSYAAGFTPRSENLLFCGHTGLGKTYLSICIARAVLERGFSVRYAPAETLIDCFERVRFSRNSTPGDSEAAREFLQCDLFILDDLGAEFSSSFSQSVLYNVINERLVAGRPTIISTNLDLRRLLEVYSERIASRLIGSFRAFAFVGHDIRQQKLLRERGDG